LGYVTSGQIIFRYADHEETYVEGDAYVAPPGHLPIITAAPVWWSSPGLPTSLR